MSTQEENLTAIAEAIREKDGATEQIPAKDFPARIRAIPKGLYPQIIVTVDAGAAVTCAGEGQSFQQTAAGGTAVFDVPGYGTWTVSAVKGGTASNTVTVAVDTAKQYRVELVFARIYGAEWDGSATTKWSRTDGAALFADPVPYVSGAASYGSPFDSIMPWAGMQRVTDSQAGELVSIPKFYFKWTKNGNALKLQLADGPVEGFYVSPAHMDRGDGKGERDVVYVGRYHCAGGYTSKTKASPQVNMTRSTARTQIHNLGSAIWQSDYAMRVTIWMLYLVEFADWNSQARIGYGGGVSTVNANTGASDSMPYHTGTMQSNRAAYGVGVQYRNIEGLWDNVLDWMDGCYYNSNGINAIMNPNLFYDTAGGTLIGKPSNEYPSAISVAAERGLEWAVYPTEAKGSTVAYISDCWDYYASYPCLLCGGAYNSMRPQDNGLFCVYCRNMNEAGTNIGCRLMKLPDPA